MEIIEDPVKDWKRGQIRRPPDDDILRVMGFSANNICIDISLMRLVLVVQRYIQVFVKVDKR